jgi:hypothetical protein
MALLAFLLLPSYAGPGVEPPPHFAAADVSAFKTFKHFVVIWVPAYGKASSFARLNESFDGVAMSDSLTHLALQFWEPTPAGNIRRITKHDRISDADIARFREWGHNHGIRVLLCLFNGVNWQLAREAFATNRAGLVAALTREVETLGLDGVDLDLEGEGDFNADRPAYVAFVKELAAALHTQDRQLTVASYAHIWHAPNQTWWPELLPLVDGLSSMGYESTGADAPGWRSYAAQKAAAGTNAWKLLLGLPAFKNSWQQQALQEHLNWITANGGVGIAIWDAQLSAPAWRQPEVWRAIATVRGNEIKIAE